MNTTLRPLEAGQSIWYDNIQRSLLRNGTLAGMIARGEIRGVTSNPTIFMNARVGTVKRLITPKRNQGVMSQTLRLPQA